MQGSMNQLATSLPSARRYGSSTSFQIFRYPFKIAAYRFVTKGSDQREGMGLLKYQAMPFLHDVALDGWLCTFTILQQLHGNFIISQLGSFCQGNRYGTEKPGGTASPSQTKSHQPGSLSAASQACHRVGPAL